MEEIDLVKQAKMTAQHEVAMNTLKSVQNLDDYQACLRNLDQRGRIELIIGCMFAGKSTEMLRRVRKHEITGKSVLTVKFSADQRYSNQSIITTHEGQTRSSTDAIELSSLGDTWRKYDVIGIDEGQFFPDIVEFAELCANNGKIVIVSSLGGTFHRGAFSKVLELIPKCEKIKKLAAICRICKQSASFTFRMAAKDDKCMIGGADKYMPVCRECHFMQTNLYADEIFTGNAEETNPDVEMEGKTEVIEGVELVQSSVSAERTTKDSPTSLSVPSKSSIGLTTASEGQSPADQLFSDEEDLTVKTKPIMNDFIANDKENAFSNKDKPSAGKVLLGEQPTFTAKQI